MLAESLYNRGFSVRLYSGSKEGEASRVSSGVVKPVTGRKFVKTWRFEQLYGKALDCYRDLERRYKVRLVQVLDILVELKGAAQENDWRARMLDDLYTPWMGLTEPAEYLNAFAVPVSQIGLIKNGLKVNVPLLTDLLLDFLKKEGAIFFEDFDHQLLQNESTEWKYKEERYKNIVFCEGFKGGGNPFLRSLRLTPLKGECLLIKSGNVPDFILQAGYSIVPWDKDTLWVGSNYNLKDSSMSVTETEMKNQLEFVNQFLRAGWSLDRKEFGFRSTSPDRRPIIGPLPGYQGLYVFNGFGTKGASLIPYCLEMLLDCLLKGEEIDQEVSVTRFAAR